jgi:transcriptional regulator with XRE-family HTH domain
MSAPWARALGRAIRLGRLRRRLTQQEAADRYGCSLRWWQSLERGRNVSVLVLHRIGRVLDVPAWKLLKE